MGNTLDDQISISKNFESRVMDQIQYWINIKF